jgi:hypothetical protein
VTVDFPPSQITLALTGDVCGAAGGKQVVEELHDADVVVFATHVFESKHLFSNNFRSRSSCFKHTMSTMQLPYMKHSLFDSCID